MSARRAVLLASFLAFVLALAPAALFAQTATQGLVNGVVTDPSGAVVPNAQVTLTEQGTNAVQTSLTDSAGHYAFPAVNPGDYALAVTAKGFRTTQISQVHVEVLKSVTVNLTLELGAATQTVEVTGAGENAQLQTTDASVGTELEGIALQRLPSFTRSANSLMFLQPAVTPSEPMSSAVGSPSDIFGGNISGARSEQITILLDGGDATSDLEGSNNYIGAPGEPEPSPVVPIPQETTEEFRVTESNPNADFGRSSGGEVAMVTKHGTNSIHGSGYEYHSDDGMDGNSWTNDTFDLGKPHQVDNRFGATVGGPVLKDRIFFYAGYEGRRFHNAQTFNTEVPNDQMRAGILEFPNAQGASVLYPLQPGNITTACGGVSCDPRGIGMSPTIKAQLALYPQPNNTALGDGFNTAGYAFTTPTPIDEDIGVMRMDFKLNSKWSVFATYHTADISRVGTEQIDILGTPHSVSADPFYPGYVSFEVTGQLTPTLTTVTHGSYLHNWWAWDRQAPAPLVSGTAEALELAGEGLGQNDSTAKLLADPVNINTQQARGRIWNGHDWYMGQDFSWVHGNHIFQFGGSFDIWNDHHLRTDDVLGGLTSAPINYVEATGNGSGEFMSVGPAYTPTNLNQSYLLRWDELYATVLGLVDRDAQIATYSGTFQANPLGSPLFDNVHIPSFYTYFQDVYKLRPSLTLTVGVNWGVQLAPSEAQGKEVVLTYANSNSPVNYYEYLNNRANALQNGGTFDPQFGYTPVASLGGPLHGEMRTTAWGDLGPRVSLAWNVPYHNWLFGENNQTVIRGGYALVYDRTSAVSEALNPLLTGGLANVDACGGPLMTGGCSQAGTTPATAFRIGVDGTSVPIPTPTAEAIPLVPSGTGTAPFGLFLSASLDPYKTPGHSHNVDLTIQRALPHNLLVELGFIGRFSRNLSQGVELDAPDYRTRIAGQTEAQAFDAVATQLRNGVKPSAVTPQPFFEHAGGGCSVAEAANGVAAGTPCTQFYAGLDSTDPTNGALSFFMQTVDTSMNNPIDDLQVFEWSSISDKGFSNYDAGFLQVNKAMSNGLQFQFNWTYAHAIGNQGLGQQYIYSANSPYNLNIDYSSELFDRKHTINFWTYYELPFGHGKQYLTDGPLSRVLGGWYVSGIFTYSTGLPNFIGCDGDYGSFLGDGTACLSNSALKNKVNFSSLSTGGLPNVFGNPSQSAAVFSSLFRPLISQYSQVPFDEFRAFPIWNIDFSLGKNLIATERYKLLLSGDFFNILNHPFLGTIPGEEAGGAESLDMNSASTFGQISGQDNQARVIQVGLRFEF